MKIPPSYIPPGHRTHDDQRNSKSPAPRDLSNQDSPSKKIPRKLFSLPQKCIVVCCVFFFAGNYLQAAIPAHYLTHEWVRQIEDRCHRRPDLCVSVQSGAHRIGWFWWGRAFYFTVLPGKTRELRTHIVQDMPDSKWARWMSPWNFVGASFTEMPPEQ